MSKPFAILVLLRGEGVFVGFSDGPVVEAQKSPSDPEVYSFGAGLSSLSVPSRSVNIFGGGGSSSASFGVLEGAIDILKLIKSGVVSSGLSAEIRYFSQGDYWLESPLLFSGVVNSLKVEPFDGSISMTLGPDIQGVNAQFPPSRVGDKGRFDSPPENTFDRVLPVVYGLVKKYPIPAVTFDLSLGGGGTVDVCLAAHEIYGCADNEGHVQIGNNSLGDMSPWHEIKSGVDNLGSPYSYITIPIENWDDGIYARDVSGKPAAGGQRMDSLGDIALDIWNSYSRSKEAVFDAARSLYANTELNRFSVGFAFTEAAKGQTVIDIMAGRIGDLPFSFSAPIGLFGWDATVVPSQDRPISGKLHYGVNVVERGSIEFKGYDKIQNRFKILYNYDDNTEGNTESVMVDETNSGLCKESQSRYGQSQYIEISIPSVSTPASAGAYVSAEISKRAIPRLQIKYFTDDQSFLQAPLLSVYELTDGEVGIKDEPFFLEAVAADIDNGGCMLTLRSLGSIERVFIGS
jgi:hypothetical protein